MRLHHGTVLTIAGFARFVPVGADAGQDAVQLVGIDEAGMGAKASPLRTRFTHVFVTTAVRLFDGQTRQAMVGEHQPGHCLGQWRQSGEWQMLRGAGLVQAVAQQTPACVIQPQRFKCLGIRTRFGAGGQLLQPAGIAITAHKGLNSRTDTHSCR